MRTATLLLVATYTQEMSPSICVEAVEKLGQFDSICEKTRFICNISVVLSFTERINRKRLFSQLMTGIVRTQRPSINSRKSNFRF